MRKILLAAAFIAAVATSWAGMASSAYAWVGNGTRGGSCEPAVVNWHRQNPPNGAICDRGPIMRHYYYPRRVVRPPVYYQPRRPVYVAPAAPCCARAVVVAPPPSPCGVSPCGGVAMAPPPVVGSVCREGFRLVPGPGVYGVLCVPTE